MILAADGVALAGRLEGVSVALRCGEVTAICGPNGAGKSSLLSLLAGLMVPDRGAVLAGGLPLPAGRERGRALGYLPQVAEVAWDLSVETLVSLGRLPWQGAPLILKTAQRAHASAAQDRAAVEHALALMDLQALRERALSSLSGGERARALLARVLAGEPRWLLADEPLASLDLAHGLRLLRALREQAAAGVGVVVVMHDLALAMNHADRVIVMDHGRIVADGAPEGAMDAAVIERVWNVPARWLGEAGRRALALG